MADSSIGYNIASLQRMAENFGERLEVATVSELSDRGAIFVEDGNHGENRPRQSEFTATGIAFLRPPDLIDGRVDFENCGRINDTGFRRVRKGIGKRGDIILTHRATVGRIAMTGDDAPEVFVTNPGTTIWRSTNPDVLDQRYLYCYMRSAAFMDQLWSQVGNNCTFDYVSLTQQRGLRVAYPPLAEQKAIGATLGALDDKIELNRRMNATLEAIARALFQSWFVDFDPVRAKLDGRQPTGVDSATTTLFPNEFEDSELGPIPKGWRAGTVVDEFSLTMGQSPPGTTYNEEGRGIPLYQGKTDFGFRFPTRRIFCTAPTRYAKTGDTLVSVRAPVGDINMASEECCVGRGVAAVRHKTGATSFTYYSMSHLYPDFARFEAEGTVFGSINKQSFENLAFVIPPSEAVAAYERQAAPLDNQIRVLEQQSRTLATLRDSLLPRLLSGQLPVSKENV